jgi:cysteinyl-tRNA synthetase
MTLYNTPDRKEHDIIPQNPPEVTVYTCGPTVYDYPHIGNWFTFIRYDLLVRTLKYSGFKPRWAINITDVGHLVSDADEGEDKLEKGARREGKTAREIADYYTANFKAGLAKLNFTQPDYTPEATQYIEEQIAIVKKLEDKGFTYETSDGVYFNTAKFPKYADFAHLNLAKQQAGGRVDANPEKKSPSDFALWKFSAKNAKREMEWDSPWGKGFPGWHLECSAMIHHFFGDTVDIHGGGIDHIPVHHTNEIAQSVSLTGKPLAKYWFHANHILISDKKISKSEGNGITLEDIEAKGYEPEVLRLLVSQSHYRSQSVFSWEDLEAAKNRLADFKAMACLKWQAIDKPDESTPLKKIEQELVDAMQDDLNSPKLIARLSQLEKILQANLLPEDELDSFNSLLKTVDGLLGLKLSEVEDISVDQKKIILERDQARQSGDWKKSDELRDNLTKEGIEVRDTQAGAIWSRK